MRNPILASIAATAILIVFISVSLRVHDQRERKQSDALYFVARQAYERFVAVKDGDESQFFPKYKDAGAAWEALNEFDISHAMFGHDVQRRDRNLQDCIDALVIRRSLTASQAMKARMERQTQQCAADPSLRTPANRK